MVLRNQAHGLAVPGRVTGRLSPPLAEQAPTKPNPGVVVVICLFVCVLVGAAAVLLVRLCRRGTPRFRHLDEVPMVCWGELGGGGGGSGAKPGVLTLLSLSSLEQSDRGVPHHPLWTQVTPAPCPPPGLPTLLNKEAAALALFSRLLCTLPRENPLVLGEATTAFGVPPTPGWRPRGAPRVGVGCGTVARKVVGAVQAPPAGWDGRERAARHARRLPSAPLHSARAAARCRDGAHREDRALVRGCG